MNENSSEKVYIPNDAGHDYSAAREYGDLVYLTMGVVKKYDVPRLYRDIADELRDSSADDYIMVGSLPILNAIAAGIQAKRHGRVNFLLYRGGSYMEKTILVT